MKLTQDDVPICRILFNEGTHAMAIALYGDRAKEIYEYICEVIGVVGSLSMLFDYRVKDVHVRFLMRGEIANFFLENKLINFSCFRGVDIYYILVASPICEKIWDSGELDALLHELTNTHIKWILEESPIADKIKQSGKLKLQTKL